MHWSVRPEYVSVVALSGPATAGDVEGRMIEVADTGLDYELFVDYGDGVEIRARTAQAPGVAPGERCRVSFRADAVSVWSAVE